MKPAHVNPAHASQQGNVLFLILIAVALFAALSYSATQSTRAGGTKSSQEDSQRVRGVEIIQYATFVAESIQRMTFRGVNNDALCFDAPLWGHANYDHSGCGSETNKVFSPVPGAGNVVWLKVPDGANAGEPWYITGNTCVLSVGTLQNDDCNSDGNNANEDIVMFLPNITKPLCLEINEQLGISNPGGNPPKASGDLWSTGMPVFAGAYADGGRVDSGGSGDLNILRGQMFGCVEGGGTPPAGSFAYYHVLVRR